MASFAVTETTKQSHHTYTHMAHITDGTSVTFAIGEAVPEWCTHTPIGGGSTGPTATCGVPLNYRIGYGDGQLKAWGW